MKKTTRWDSITISPPCVARPYKGLYPPLSSPLTPSLTASLIPSLTDSLINWINHTRLALVNCKKASPFYGFNPLVPMSLSSVEISVTTAKCDIWSISIKYLTKRCYKKPFTIDVPPKPDRTWEVCVYVRERCRSPHCTAWTHPDANWIHTQA